MIEKIKNKEFEIALMALALVFYLFGILIVYKASGYYAFMRFNKPPFFFAGRHMIFGIAGIFCMLFFIRFNLKNLRIPAVRAAYIIFSFLLLFLTLNEKIGVKISGSRRWIDLGLFNFQPSELAKIFLIFFLADFLDTYKYEIKNSVRILVPTLFVTLIYVALIIKEPDFSTTCLIMGIWFSMLFISGVELKGLIISVLIIAIFASIFVINEPYRRKRIFGWFNKNASTRSEGYHITRSKMAIINGGLFGKGITGRGMNIVGVPEAHTDFIFSIMCETFGYLGIMIFLFLFALFLFKGYKLAMAAKSMYYKLLAFGISFLFTLHFIINIGVVIGLFPITGITLPFFSYGGTSIVCSMICVGILLNVSNNLNS